jgi:hypothetical protein
LGSSNESAQASSATQVLSFAQRLNQAIRFTNNARRAWDTISWIRDAMSLGEFASGEKLAISAGLDIFKKLVPHVNLGPLSIPIPNSIVNRLRHRIGPVLDTPPMQAMIGVAFAALVSTLLDWQTTSIEADYRGVDAILRASSGLYIVMEAKGGTSSPQNGQMADSWIESRVRKAIRKNPGSDATALTSLVRSGPLIAVVISTELRGAHPHMAIELQTYPGIKGWRI